MEANIKVSDEIPNYMTIYKHSLALVTQVLALALSQWNQAGKWGQKPLKRWDARCKVFCSCGLDCVTGLPFLSAFSLCLGSAFLFPVHKVKAGKAQEAFYLGHWVTNTPRNPSKEKQQVFLPSESLSRVSSVGLHRPPESLCLLCKKGPYGLTWNPGYIMNIFVLWCRVKCLVHKTETKKTFSA